MNFGNHEKISKDFFYGKGIDVAEQLIGKVLKNEENNSSGIIVETEAYLGENDPSCHFAKNKEGKRGKIFNKGAGTLYVYNIHTHNCMNFISDFKGNPEGILIRAVKPVKGIEEMKQRRGFEEETKLASGPGKLTEAIGITKQKHNGEKISESPISIYETERSYNVEVSSRIGISEAKDWPARFYAKGSSYVSKTSDQKDTDFDFNSYYTNLE